MGYETRFGIEWTLNSPPEIVEIAGQIFKEFREEKELDYIFDEDGFANDTAKWYEHEEDIRELSRLCPEAVFVLYGEGEEAGDIWYKYFKNGLMQMCEAQITYEDYDESKLK